MEIGELIRTARHGARLSQRDLAAAAGTSAPALSRYERGHVLPGSATLLRILAATGHTLRLDPTAQPELDAETVQQIRVQFERSVEARLEDLMAMVELRRQSGLA